MARSGTRIRLPGLVLMRQRPGTAKGIVFVTVEDEFGTANLVVHADVGARERAALVGARLLVAEGRVERQTEHVEVLVRVGGLSRSADDELERFEAAGRPVYRSFGEVPGVKS